MVIFVYITILSEFLRIQMFTPSTHINLVSVPIVNVLLHLLVYIFNKYMLLHGCTSLSEQLIRCLLV